MDIESLVNSIKFYCAAKGVKPTVACRESGVGGSFINNMESRGSVPSVEKVQMLAQYLGVTVSELLGETGPPQQPKPPQYLTGHSEPRGRTPADPPGSSIEAVLHSPPFIRLTLDEVDMIEAYRKADDDTRTIVDAALRRFRKKEKSASGG